MPSPTDSCAACGASTLLPYLRVADAAGADLIPTTDQFGSALADIVRCKRCGHGQLERMPTEVELGEAYGEAASDDYVEEEAGQRATARIALERIERHVATPPGERALLDLGCWVGFLLAEANERGWRTLGVEPSDFASAYARDELGLDVIHGDLLESDIPLGEWDAVVLGDVIEHLIDPAAALDRIAQLLKPGGIVYMAIPDAGSRLARKMGTRWWSVIPTHVQYFTRRSIGELVARQGYRVEYLGTAPKAFSVRYYLGRIGGYSEPVAAATVKAAELTGVADSMWAPDFRDRMAVIARGPSRRRSP